MGGGKEMIWVPEDAHRRGPLAGQVGVVIDSRDGGRGNSPNKGPWDKSKQPPRGESI